MIRFAWLIATLVLPAVHAADYCAFRVNIEDPDGRLQGVAVPIAVKRSDGTVVATATARDGKADICDVGFGSFDIEVGWDKSCGQVVFRRLTPDLMAEISVWARLPLCWDPSWLASGCRVLFRVRSADQTPAVGATVEIQEKVTPLRTDGLGRVLVAMEVGQTSSFRMVYGATATEKITLTCTARDARLERTLSLK